MVVGRRCVTNRQTHLQSRSVLSFALESASSATACWLGCLLPRIPEHVRDPRCSRDSVHESFHDEHGCSRMKAARAALLRFIVAWVWVLWR